MFDKELLDLGDLNYLQLTWKDKCDIPIFTFLGFQVWNVAKEGGKVVQVGCQIA